MRGRDGAQVAAPSLARIHRATAITSRSRRVGVGRVMAVALVGLLAGCAASTGSPSTGQVTVPVGAAESTSSSSKPTSTTAQDVDTTSYATTTEAASLADAERVVLEESWFGRPKADAIAGLEKQGFTVADFYVCSGSVERDQVRQLLTNDGVILDDKDGLTADGRSVEPGIVIQMKVGTGTAC